MNLSATCTLDRGQSRFSGQSSRGSLQVLIMQITVWEDQQNTHFALMNQEQPSYGNFCFYKSSRFDSRMSCEMQTPDWGFQYCEKTLPLNLCFISFSPVITRIFRHLFSFYVLIVLSKELSCIVHLASFIKLNACVVFPIHKT